MAKSETRMFAKKATCRRRDERETERPNNFWFGRMDNGGGEYGGRVRKVQSFPSSSGIIFLTTTAIVLEWSSSFPVAVWSVCRRKEGDEGKGRDGRSSKSLQRSSLSLSLVSEEESTNFLPVAYVGLPPLGSTPSNGRPNSIMCPITVAARRLISSLFSFLSLALCFPSTKIP